MISVFRRNSRVFRLKDILFQSSGRLRSFLRTPASCNCQCNLSVVRSLSSFNPVKAHSVEPSAQSTASVPSSTSSSTSSTVASPSATVSPPARLSPTSSTWTASSSSLLGEPGRVMIYASEVAVLAGLNRYRPLFEAFERIWARTEPETYRERIAEAEQQLGIKLLTKDQECELLLEASTQLSSEFKQILESISDLSLEELESHKRSLKRMVAVLVEAGKHDWTEAQRTLLVDYMHGSLSKAYGIQNEERALKAYELIADLTVLDNNRLFYAKQITECIVQPHEINHSKQKKHQQPSTKRYTTDHNPHDPSDSSPPTSTAATSDFHEADKIRLRRSLWIGGRVDGFSSTTGNLIEMKNRTKRFLTPLPLYDRCQLECYLQVCEVSQGELIERLREKVDEKKADKEQKRIAEAVQQSNSRKRHNDHEELEQTRLALETADLDHHEDSAFLGSAVVNVPVATSRTVPTEHDVEHDVDFLNDPTPLKAPETLESDDSFLGSASSKHSPPSKDSNIKVLSPSSSLEVFGTQYLMDNEDQSITHMLIREIPAQLPDNDLLELDPSESVLGSQIRMTTKEEEDSKIVQVADDSIAHNELIRGFISASQPEIIDQSESSNKIQSSTPTQPLLYIDRIKRTVLKRDDQVWRNRLLPSITHFGHFLTKFLAEPQRQLLYLCCRTDEEKMEMLKEITPTIVSVSSSYSSQKQRSFTKRSSKKPNAVSEASSSSQDNVNGKRMTASASVVSE